MKTKKQLFIIVLLLMQPFILHSQDNQWRFINFECGGYVTEVIPLKYPGSLPPSMDNQVLYARTDIGGIYRSTNNGLTWIYVSNYLDATPRNPGITPSELSIQGLAIRNNSPDPFDSQRLVAAVGHDITDAQSSTWRSIWYSINNGDPDSWSKATIQSPQMRFLGNDLRVKIGGPCILYDPNNSSVLYAGGFPQQEGFGQKPYLFKSTDDGVTWINRNQVILDNFYAMTLPEEGIICIAIKPGNTQHMWVGTTKGILFTTNAGTEWQRRYITGVSEPYVKRIILQKDASNNITGAMAVWGNWNGTGICRFRIGNNWMYENITDNFYTGFSGSASGMFSTLAFVDDNETMIIAGRYERPLRKTTNFGSSWFGESNNSDRNEVVFRYVDFGHNFPAHQQRGELHPQWGHMYDGLSCLTRNPNPDWGNHWYLSGGAGARMTVTGTSNNDFSGSEWKYTTFGQSMTVVYDVVFNKISQNGFPNGNARAAFYFPLSDWTLGWTYGDRLTQSHGNRLIPDTISYDRQETRWDSLYDTYISNVTRTLIHPDSANISYNIGGSVYNFATENRRAACYKRKISYFNGDEISYNQRYQNDLLYHTDNRAMVDGIIFSYSQNPRIVVLVGLSDAQSPPIWDYTGIYYSDNEGYSWTKGLFDLPSEKEGITTQAAYNNAVLPSLNAGSIGDLFDGHFQLTYAGNSRIYLWLESNGSEPYGGGLFRSDDNGANWRKADDPDDHTGYFGPGTLKYIGNNQLVLAFRDFRIPRRGFYKGIINPSNGSVSWSEFGVSGSDRFTQAEHFDNKGSKWAVYGKRTGDEYNQIYRSLDNGNTWERIPPNNLLPYFPKVHSLRIRELDGSLWIATSGQGVWVYRQFSPSGDIEPWIITENTTVDYTDYYPMDIIVTNGATLTFTSQTNIRIDFAPNRGITVEPGSRIVCNNITFGCPLGDWNGIKLVDSYQCNFQNVTFNNTKKPVEILNSPGSNNNFRKSFNNCIFNLANGGQYCISAFDQISLNVSNCQFNMTGSPMAYGIQLEYYHLPSGGPAGSGDAPPPTVTVLNNTFTDGVTHLFFNCNLAGITPFYIHNNTFVRTSDASGIGLSASRITGRFINNTFSTNQFTKNVTLIECNLDFYGNYFSGNVNSNLELDVNSYCRLEPLIVNGEYIWLGGFNEINMNNSSTAQNITFTYGSFPATDRGRNCFVLNNNNFNIFGDLEESFGRTYYTRYNGWNQGPNFRIIRGGQNADVIYLPINECIPTEELNNYLLYYQVIDLGNGIYDSIPVTTSPGGASVPPDLGLYIAARNHKNQRNYHIAIDNLKSLVNQFDSSKYLFSALNDLFINYKLTDSTGNQSIRNQLFGELKTYLQDKLQQYQGNFSVSDRIYGYFLMCLVMQRQYSQAISGYENIMNNHPNAMSRLKASWDRAAAIIAQQQGGSGGGETQETEPSSDRKPPHLIAKEIYENQKQHRNKITESNQDNESSRDAVVKEFDRKKDNLIQSRLTYLNPLNRIDLFEKIKEDIRIINNIKPQGNIKDNSLPKRFQLHQNYPNPFNPLTKIKYELPKDVNVTITVYDILGREVIRLVNNEYRKAGIYEAEWNALNYASGVYFYRIEAGSFVDAKKMVLVR